MAVQDPVFTKGALLQYRPSSNKCPLGPEDINWKVLPTATALRRGGVGALGETSETHLGKTHSEKVAIAEAPWRKKNASPQSSPQIGPKPSRSWAQVCSKSLESSPSLSTRNPSEAAPGLSNVSSPILLEHDPDGGETTGQATTKPGHHHKDAASGDASAMGLNVHAVPFAALTASHADGEAAAPGLLKPWEFVTPPYVHVEGPFADDCSEYTRSVMQAALAVQASHMGGGKGGKGKGKAKGKDNNWAGNTGGAPRDVTLESAVQVGPTPPPDLASLSGTWKDTLGNTIEVPLEAQNAWIHGEHGKKDVHLSVDQWGRLWCGNGVLLKVGYANHSAQSCPSHLAWRTTGWKVSTWTRVPA